MSTAGVATNVGETETEERTVKLRIDAKKLESVFRVMLPNILSVYNFPKIYEMETWV